MRQWGFDVHFIQNFAGANWASPVAHCFMAFQSKYFKKFQINGLKFIYLTQGHLLTPPSDKSLLNLKGWIRSDM